MPATNPVNASAPTNITNHPTPNTIPNPHGTRIDNPPKLWTQFLEWKYANSIWHHFQNPCCWSSHDLSYSNSTWPTLAKFLDEEHVDHCLLNLKTSTTSCIIAFPDAGHWNAKIIFRPGTSVGATKIHDKTIYSNFLSLTGEIEQGLSAPNVMTLPLIATTTQTFTLQSEEVFESA